MVVGCLTQQHLYKGPQISRSWCWLNCRALEGIFSIRWNSDLSAALRYQHTLPSWLVLTDALLLASGAWWEVWWWNTSQQSLASHWKLSHSERPVPWEFHLGNEGKAAFLLHKYFNSFKYGDNWSALVVTIQVQEPGLASLMNRKCGYHHLSPAKLNHHPSSKNKNNLMKIGKWAPDISNFSSKMK